MLSGRYKYSCWSCFVLFYFVLFCFALLCMVLLCSSFCLVLSTLVVARLHLMLVDFDILTLRFVIRLYKEYYKKIILQYFKCFLFIIIFINYISHVSCPLLEEQITVIFSSLIFQIQIL